MLIFPDLVAATRMVAAGRTAHTFATAGMSAYLRLALAAVPAAVLVPVAGSMGVVPAGLAPLALGLAGLAGLAPTISAELVAAAPAMIKSAVNAAVEAAAPKHVASLYTDEYEEREPETCGALNKPESPEMGFYNDTTYSPPDDTVSRIKETLAIVVDVTAFDERACTLDVLIERVGGLSELIASVSLWANTELVMYLAVAFGGESDLKWIPDQTIGAIRAALRSLVEGGARDVLAPPEKLRASPSGVRGALGALSAAASKVARYTGVSRFLWDFAAQPPPALALRQCEVAMRALGSPANSAFVAAFVAHVRARTWSDWLSGHLKLDELRFFGYDFLDLPGGVRRPLAAERAPSPHWAVELAYSAATALYPDVFAQVTRITELAMATAPRTRYVGYEPPGVGLALLRATETRALLEKYDARYAPAHAAVVRYAAALLSQEPGPETTLRSVQWKDRPKEAPGKSTKVPRACVDARGDETLRKGRTYQKLCVRAERDGARRGLAVDALAAASSVDQLFALIDDVGLLPPESRGKFKQKVLALNPKPKEGDAQQMRRLEVMRALEGAEAQSAGKALFERAKTNALAGKPHGLAVHELGCEHTAVVLGNNTVARAMFTPGPLEPAWLERAATWLAATVAPGATELVSELAAETRRTAQYQGLESPGTGYALVQLLAILDDASARGEAHAFVRSATLSAVELLLVAKHAP